MPDLVKNKVIFHHDKTVRVTAKIHEMQFNIVLHASYSPDLASFDFSLYPNFKKFLAVKRYGCDSEVIAAMNVTRIKKIIQKTRGNLSHNCYIFLVRPETFHFSLVHLYEKTWYYFKMIVCVSIYYFEKMINIFGYGKTFSGT